MALHSRTTTHFDALHSVSLAPVGSFSVTEQQKFLFQVLEGGCRAGESKMEALQPGPATEGTGGHLGLNGRAR